MMVAAMVLMAAVSTLSAESKIDIWSAIETNNIEKFQTWLAGKPNINIRDSEKRTPLMYAIINVNPTMVGKLLAKGADLKLADRDDNTVLHVLFHRVTLPIDTQLEDIESITKQLLAKGTVVNDANKGGDTPLIVACNLGGYRRDHASKVIDLLLDAGATTNDRNKKGECALYFAAVRNSTEVVRSLTKHGVDVNARFVGNTTALLWAAQNKNTEMIRILLETGADPNLASDSKNTPLSLLVQDNKTLEAVKLLIAHQADVNAKNKDGKTPLNLANWSKKLNGPIIKALTEAGAK
jgi:ankyrin repeat protein